MKDIIKSYPAFVTEVDTDTLRDLRTYIVEGHYDIYGAMRKVGIDPRYYGHWVDLAKGGDDRARALVLYLQSLLDDKMANILGKVASSRDAKALMMYAEFMMQLNGSLPQMEQIGSSDENTLYIGEDWS